MKYKITFKEKVTLFWNDPEDLDGYRFGNEKDYYPRTEWKTKADSLVVEIAEVGETIIVKDGSKTCKFNKLHEKCEVEKIVEYV